MLSAFRSTSVSARLCCKVSVAIYFKCSFFFCRTYKRVNISFDSVLFQSVAKFYLLLHGAIFCVGLAYRSLNYVVKLIVIVVRSLVDRPSRFAAMKGTCISDTIHAILNNAIS
jgi:hypothetical protein